MTEKSYEVLSYVRDHNGYCRISEICDALGRNARSITANVNDLVKKGMLTREEHDEDGADKPVKFARVTDDGINYVPEEDNED